MPKQARSTPKAKARAVADRYIGPKGGKPTSKPRKPAITPEEIRSLGEIAERYVAEIPRHPRGRPTKYKPEYCQVVIDDAIRGHSLTATAALIGVDRSLFGDWCAVHPDFLLAVSHAKGIRLRSFESDFIDMKQNGGDNVRFQAVKLGMMNVAPDEYKEKISSEATITITLATLIQESMKLAPPTIDAEVVVIDNKGE